MRDFVRSGTVSAMRSLPAILLALLVGCNSPTYEAITAAQDQFETVGSTGSGDVAETTSDAVDSDAAGTEGASASTGETGNATDATGPGETGSTTDTSNVTDTDDSPPVGDAEKPKIVSVELPDNVYAAGPVPLAVQTEHTGSVRVTLDGADAGELIAVGGGLFTGELPVHGAIDNGQHAIEVIAKQGPYEDHRPDFYNVSTPAPGTEAWSQAGPVGSRTNRMAITSARDLIEVGQTEINGVPRPTIRKRSGVTGAELWPEKTIVLDTREGAVVDVAVLPDGRMWVAMNVDTPNTDPLPRIVLLDADGHEVGIEVLGTTGRVVRALAADADGGCFAVGLAGVMGDWDVAFWSINAAGVQTLGDTYDYRPPKHEAHSFLDLASDVVIDGDVAWIVGMSKGQHDNDLNDPAKYLRGVLVPMDLHTGKIVGSVIVAPPTDLWPQSAFFGAAFDPEGVLVTGYGCDLSCSKYRIEASRYSVGGERTWFSHENTNSALAYGSDITLDSQGRALVAGAVSQNGKLRGYVFAREIGINGPILLEHWYPGVGASEALGILRDSFDRIFPAGYITVSGETQARVTLLHG